MVPGALDADASLSGAGHEDGRIGVLAMAYGTPSDPEQIEAYYTHIRRGRSPAPEQLAELRARYEAIGGNSPLVAITQAQATALARALADAGHPLTVELGYKHAPPFIEEGVERLLAAGVARIVGIVLAPHYSRMSVGEYEQRVRAAAAAAPDPPEVAVVGAWHLAPSYLELLARACTEGVLALPAPRRAGAHVLFTAHSLPARILDAGDPYPDQLRETAQAVARIAGLERWGIAWQSAGRTADPWIGPDVLEAISELASRGVEAVVVCPCGFVSDHLEILYDLDIEAAAHAAALGVAFARTASPNAAPELAQAMAGAVIAELAAVAR